MTWKTLICAAVAAVLSTAVAQVLDDTFPGGREVGFWIRPGTMSSSRVTDLTGRVPLSLTNGVTIVGSALSFTGKTCCAISRTGVYRNGEFTNGITMVAAFQQRRAPTNSTDNGFLIGMDNYNLTVETTSMVGTVQGSGAFYLRAALPSPSNTFHVAALSCNPSGSRLRIWIDGKLAASGTNLFLGVTSNSMIWVGGTEYIGVHGFDGLIYGVGLYGYEMNHSEIQAITTRLFQGRR